MLNILWPKNPKADPSALCRLGRVVHRSATALAVPCVLWTAQIAITENRGSDYSYFILLWIGGAIYLAGRAARYVLGGE